MQNSYVQIAVCGPSRSSILTGRRPDSTQVVLTPWCWCQRTQCREDELFMTLPTYLAQHGYATSGTGKIFHPDACSSKAYGPNFAHTVGDDYRAWSTGVYGVEGLLQKPYDHYAQQYSEEQVRSRVVGASSERCNFWAGHTMVHCVPGRRRRASFRRCRCSLFSSSGGGLVGWLFPSYVISVSVSVAAASPRTRHLVHIDRRPRRCCFPARCCLMLLLLIIKSGAQSPVRGTRTTT